MTIADGRPFRGDFGLDGSGFPLLEQRSTVTDFGDRDQLDSVYAREISGLVRNVTVFTGLASGAGGLPSHILIAR